MVQFAPGIDARDIERVRSLASAYLAGPVVLKVNEIEARYQTHDIARPLTVITTSGPSPTVEVRFDSAPLTALVASLELRVNRQPMSSGFAIDGDRAVITSPSVVGRLMDVAATTTRTLAAVTSSERTVPLVVSYAQPRIADDEVRR